MSKYEKGKIITGCVTGIENYGIFVTLDEYYNGLIHISEISNNFVRNIGDYVNVGETIKAKVVDTDEENYHVKLSIKDIDYRMNNQRKTKIVETNEGFMPLKNNLDKWIMKKMTEIDKKNNI